MRGGGAVTWPPSAIGGGDAINGFWVGTAGDGVSYLIVAPKSTEATGISATWGSQGITRGTVSTTDGIGNTNKLYSYGNTTASGHPAAYYCKSLTTGGYNTWYLPAKAELNTCYSSNTILSTNDAITGTIILSSTEADGNLFWYQAFWSGAQNTNTKSASNGAVRAVRHYNKTTNIGEGNSSAGFWLGTAGDGVSKLIVAPKSTEVQRAWGSYGTVRNTTSTTNGVANTTTLFGFGSAAHPAAYYCRALTTGGYNTWYLPAKNELNTLYSNKSAVPFATANSFVGSYYCSSTEDTGYTAWGQNMNTGNQNTNAKNGGYYVRATRRSTI